MILKSITLTGFKSFAKKTVIDISKNVTGIVGPNGSGKSNIAEAVRFVMGEQSMKSIRSKSMGDLVFKGSQHIGPMSRASVSIDIDNKVKIYNEGVSPELAQYLSYDEITLSREVFVDGGSVYKINGGEVRLKDVQSLLALAGIGASAHTIISQGEADKILMSSAKDRKEMIEDALGLKIHQIRLKDSERKLKKVSEHIYTVELLRKEIAPELSHLKVQMEKINKIEGEREKLLAAYLNYFAYESDSMSSLKNKIANNKNVDESISVKRLELNNLKLREQELTKVSNTNVVSELELNIKRDINELSEKRLNLEREISVLMYEKKGLLSKITQEVKDITIDKNLFLDFKNDINQNINKLDMMLANNKSQDNFVLNFSENINSILEVNNNIKNILSTTNIWVKENNNQEYKTQIDRLDTDILTIESQIQNIKNDIAAKNSEIEIENENKRQEDNRKLESVKHIYNDIYNLEREITALETDKMGMYNDMQNMQKRESEFIFRLDEAQRFVGPAVIKYKLHNIDDKYNHYDNERLVERLKIRIEEIGVLDPTSVKNSFEEISSRELHLATEIADLHNTKKSLDDIMIELENNIKNDFNKGVEKINFAFNNLFHEIFPGGRASIHVEKLLEKDEDGDDTTDVVEGINLSISLPSKKVSDINMLSGGEKTLASIALLFALTSITPPPFMVLDETDAALDEMNARKYGKLLSKLAEKSRLLVITHNRETMNECDLLYGVTVGGDGSSKILSIKFD